MVRAATLLVVAGFMLVATGCDNKKTAVGTNSAAAAATADLKAPPGASNGKPGLSAK